jgi:hypothetical protein
MASWMTASDVAVRYSLGGCDPCGCMLPAPSIRRPGVQPTFGAPILSGGRVDDRHHR